MLRYQVSFEPVASHRREFVLFSTYTNGQRVGESAQERSPVGARLWTCAMERDLNHVSGHDSSEQREQRTITQSERDWSYALRNLHEGTPPSEVIEQIAAFRSDKPDPQYYAEHTVQKALAELAERRGSHSVVSDQVESRGDTKDRTP